MNVIGAPDLDPNESNYAHCRVEEIMPIPADTFFDWYIGEPIENFMLGTLIVPPIVGTKTMTESPFGAPGSDRLIHFKDRTVARERVLTSDYPRSYSYQPYAYTNPMRLFSDHAKATMTAVPEGEHARIVWDYAFHARSTMALPIVRLFVQMDWKRNLAGGLKVIRAHLEQHGTSRRIHEVRPSRQAA